MLPSEKEDAAIAVSRQEDSISLQSKGDLSSSDDAPPPPPVAISHGAVATNEAYISDAERGIAEGTYKIPFRWRSLWQPEVLNPINQKSMTLCIFAWQSPYAIGFWFATLGFFTAFLSWFAFSPLLVAVRTDLGLTAAQMANSNIVALSGTILVRFIAGPLVDRYGPRKVMAGILLLGVIPSGLAGLAHNAGSLYAVRFFISFLGGTFVPCQAWTTAWFDRSVVGTANAMAGGWGNLGGGITHLTQTGIYDSLVTHAGLKSHIAWRTCFVMLPVPCLILVAVTMLLFARDHPMGKWSQRFETPATEYNLAHGKNVIMEAQAKQAINARDPEKTISEKAARNMVDQSTVAYKPSDVAVNEPLTKAAFVKLLIDPRTWMLALSYATSFGYELALDANLANSTYALFKSSTFNQHDAGYAAAAYGLMNICFRLFGGLGSDWLYARYGIQSKKFWLLACAGAQGVLSIGLGFHIDSGLSFGAFMGWIVAIAATGFAANGANYSVVPHVNPKNNGVMCGIVGAAGSLGGIIYAMIFRFSIGSAGKPYWVSGIFCAAANLILVFVPLGDAV